MFTAKAVELIREFKEKFPDLFEAMEMDDAQDVEVFSPEQLFRNGNHVERLAEVYFSKYIYE